jgi:hypothetical protein
LRAGRTLCAEELPFLLYPSKIKSYFPADSSINAV